MHDRQTLSLAGREFAARGAFVSGDEVRTMNPALPSPEGEHPRVRSKMKIG
jgi:hypothetical protein